MKKIISIIVAIVVIAVLIYLFVTKPSTEITPVTIDTTKSISDVVDKSNPFDVKVDPYQGYKNPFE